MGISHSYNRQSYKAKFFMTYTYDMATGLSVMNSKSDDPFLWF